MEKYIFINSGQFAWTLHELSSGVDFVCKQGIQFEIYYVYYSLSNSVYIGMNVCNFDKFVQQLNLLMVNTIVLTTILVLVHLAYSQSVFFSFPLCAIVMSDT